MFIIFQKKSVPTGADKSDLKEMKPEENQRYTWADIGAGRLFADYFRSVARYVPECKMWYCFDGTRWVPDIGAVRASEFCKQLADELNRYAIGLEDEKKKVDYMAYCRKWYSHNFRDTVLKEAHSVYPIQMEEFDTDIFAFNCENGTLHLNTMEFLPHNPEDKITKKSSVNYSPKVRFKRWDDFIVEVMSGDAEKAKFLQKSFGYTLPGDTQYECLFILHGYQTRNGKGTLCESVLHVMGDYGAVVSPETIALRQHNNSNSPSEDKIAFDWFTLSDPADAACYVQFIYALCETAKEKKRITATKPDFFENEKFAMRVWLNGLGLSGKEHKNCRALLMRGLSGDAAWRYSKPEKLDFSDESEAQGDE